MTNSEDTSQPNTNTDDINSVHHPLYFHQNDHPGLVLISKKLTGSENYNTWRRSMMIALDARNKLKLINGEFEEPPNQIGNNLSFVNSATSLWNELYEHYSQLDGHRIYQVSNDIVQLKQTNTPISLYYYKLKGYWDELDDLEASYACTCKCNCENRKTNGEREQRKRVIQFLMGLDDSYTNGDIAFKDQNWRDATTKEIQALKNNKTWTFTTLPLGKTLNGSKWVFKIKLKADGVIDRYKARLVAKGFNHIYKGLSFKPITHVAKMPTVRTLIAMAVHNGWPIQQLDVNNAFLHGDLNEEAYMTVPQGYPHNLPPNSVCKLTKSLYGLKQANKQWFEKLTTFLLSLGFKQSYVDTSLFTINHQNSITSLLVYVDDILLTGKDATFLQHIKTQLHTMFSIKDLGPIHYYLVATPMDPIVKLNEVDAQALSQFSHNPRTPHLAALHKVLRYIKLCPGQGIYFSAFNKLELTTYCDSDWASCQTTRRSSTEAEADSTCEISWLKCLLHDLGINIPTPSLVMCDNASTIALANNPVQHARTKHIEIDCHFVRDKIRQGHIKPIFVSSQSQIADILTKGLNKYLHYNCLSKLNICDPYTVSTCWGDKGATSTTPAKGLSEEVVGQEEVDRQARYGFEFCDKNSSFLVNGYLNTVVDCIPAMSGLRLKDIPPVIRHIYPGDEYMAQFLYISAQRAKTASAIIFNTFHELEPEVFDTLSLTFPPCYGIGPLHLLEKTVEDNSLASIKLSMWKEESECLEWLDSRATCSVVYVSFGSVTVMTQQQLVEFCWGLAKSNYPFLWIIRPDLVIGDSAMLPPEFLKETSERSLLVGWCPQEQVLSHPSIGGFLTHSGWNSTLESISNGIPMICWPFFADQQPNCWWSCNKWGIAMVIDNNVKSDEVSRLVIELMNGDKGKGMRKNTMEWKKKADESCVAPGGSSIANLEKLIHLLQMCIGVLFVSCGPGITLVQNSPSKGFDITFVNTEFNHQRLLRSQGSETLNGLLSFRFETIPDGLPPPENKVATQDLPSLAKSVDETCSGPFKSLVNKVGAFYSPVTCIVADVLMGFTLEVAKELDIPEFLFWTAGTGSLVCHDRYPNLLEKGLMPLKGT
ncbi:7-deoxyloganetin glucosyltransferase-like protein [Tanacetum coccineum]|uniref:7-deoxyloganetin glucosyltransferase-like protein n=1 Tax=Tanacetum coccineum TaxID=301880 RepID=A0ABQ5C517_9ASTR